MSAPAVGTLTVSGQPPASITMDGVWSCEDPELADLLNEHFGPDAIVLGPSVLPHAVRALRTAGVRLAEAKVEMLHSFDELPEGLLS